MRCENCGAEIVKGEIYCPNCGMELYNSESKPLQKKFIRGEYQEEAEIPTEPYNLEEDTPETTYQDPYQDSYQYEEYEEYENKNYKTKYERDEDYNPRYNQDNYNQKSYHRRGYDLGDEDFEYEETKSSIWGTVFLFLVIALLFGFVMGFMFFSIKL
jgi:uncharacterized Zn finger protein (UPF0148 family)